MVNFSQKHMQMRELYAGQIWELCNAKEIWTILSGKNISVLSHISSQFEGRNMARNVKWTGVTPDYLTLIDISATKIAVKM